MKKNIFIAALAATAMLASCAEEPANGPGNGRGEATRINLTLKDASSSTRAIDVASVDADAAINDFIVFVVRADGKTFDISPKYFATGDIAADNEYQITATTNASKVYIVTNTGAYSTGAFKDVTDFDGVKAVAMKIDGNPNTASNVKPQNVWMAGEALTLTDEADKVETVGTVTTTTKVKSATIKLNYIAAKVFVVTENHMKNYVGGNTLLEGVAMFNAGAWTGFVNKGTAAAPDYRVTRGTSVPQAPYYYNGLVITAFPDDYQDVPAQAGGADDFALPAGTAISSYTYKLANMIGHPTTAEEIAPYTDASTTRENLTDADAFYCFPTEDTETKVWAAVYGKYNKEGVDTPAKLTAAEQTFWSVAFSGGDKTIPNPLASGNKYIITLELKGDAKIPGEPDPTKDIVNQYLKITLEQAAWVVSEPRKTFE